MNNEKLDVIMNLYKQKIDLEKQMNMSGILTIELHSWGHEIEITVESFIELFPDVEGYRNRSYYGDIYKIYEKTINKVKFTARKPLQLGNRIISRE